MKKKFRNTRTVCSKVLAIIAVIALLSAPQRALASEDEEYITISVDAMDGSGRVMYALDTDNPEAFTESNEFTVPAGTDHIIYVKDEAGNITSQKYSGQISNTPDSPYLPDGEEENGMQEEGDFHIDIELDRTSPGTDAYQYQEPPELGMGTVYDKTKENLDAESEKIFYTVTTNEGEVFYLVIDQGQTSNNVYLLDQVKLSDLKALAMDDTEAVKEEEKSDSLLDALSNTDAPAEILSENEPAEHPPEKSSNTLFILILAAAGGAVYYYMKVYKNKKNVQMDLADAMEREDFEADYPEEDTDFELEEGYQEDALNRLFEEEDGAADTGPEEMETEGEEETVPEKEFEPEHGNFEPEFFEPEFFDTEFDEEE